MINPQSPEGNPQGKPEKATGVSGSFSGFFRPVGYRQVL